MILDVMLPSWTISGILSLLMGLMVANYIRGQDYGADQPQHPASKKFITDDNDFWRWLVGGLAASGLTSVVTPELVPTLNTTFTEASTGMKILLGVIVLYVLKGIFKSWG